MGTLKYTPVHNYILAGLERKPTQALLLCALLSKYDQVGKEFYTTGVRLSEETGLKVQQIKDAKRELIKAGLVTSNGGSNGSAISVNKEAIAVLKEQWEGTKRYTKVYNYALWGMDHQVPHAILLCYMQRFYTYRNGPFKCTGDHLISATGLSKKQVKVAKSVLVKGGFINSIQRKKYAQSEISIDVGRVASLELEYLKFRAGEDNGPFGGCNKDSGGVGTGTAKYLSSTLSCKLSKEVPLSGNMVEKISGNTLGEKEEKNTNPSTAIEGSAKMKNRTQDPADELDIVGQSTSKTYNAPKLKRAPGCKPKAEDVLNGFTLSANATADEILEDFKLKSKGSKNLFSFWVVMRAREFEMSPTTPKQQELGQLSTFAKVVGWENALIVIKNVVEGWTGFVQECADNGRANPPKKPNIGLLVEMAVLAKTFSDGVDREHDEKAHSKMPQI